MIDKLKRKFTILATVSIVVLMSVLVTIMNVVNYSSVVKESDDTLDLLVKLNDRSFDFGNKPLTDAEPPKNDFELNDVMPPNMSHEVPYESRFFFVFFDEDGQEKYELSRISSVGEEDAENYVKKAKNSRKSCGFVDQYRFLKTDNGRIYFLDCGRKLDAFTSFMWTSITVGLLGCIAVFFAFLFVSGKIVKPIAESYEKQKRFISDAGHEIKTPLTIISANADLLESEGESEELAEIKAQTKRLAVLTKDLVSLSKMEESDKVLTKVTCPLSDIADDTCASFRAPALANRLLFKTDIQSHVEINGAPDALSQLFSILLENAVKYTPRDGFLSFELKTKRRNAEILISNSVSEAVGEEDLPHLFDRFYRTDASRNSKTGGHGIGLSIAKAIVENHHGTIRAACEGNVFSIHIALPL